LTNITDVVSNASSFGYDGSGVITNLHTPYGSTGFSFTQQTNDIGYGLVSVPVRSAEITLSTGNKELYVSRDSVSAVPSVPDTFVSYFKENPGAEGWGHGFE